MIWDWLAMYSITLCSWNHEVLRLPTCTDFSRSFAQYWTALFGNQNIHPRKVTWKLKRMVSKAGISKLPGVHVQVNHVRFRGSTKTKWVSCATKSVSEIPGWNSKLFDLVIWNGFHLGIPFKTPLWISKGDIKPLSRWRFQIFFMLTPIWGNDPFWSIFLNLVVSNTN